jgi:hypothetical protein
VWRGDVGGANGRSRGGSGHVLWGRHHLGHGGAVGQDAAVLLRSGDLLCLVTPPRVRIVVYSGMASELV